MFRWTSECSCIMACGKHLMTLWYKFKRSRLGNSQTSRGTSVRRFRDKSVNQWNTCQNNAPSQLPPVTGPFQLNLKTHSIATHQNVTLLVQLFVAHIYVTRQLSKAKRLCKLDNRTILENIVSNRESSQSQIFCTKVTRQSAIEGQALVCFKNLL